MLEAVAEFRRRGRPPIDSPKVRIGFRLAPDVVRGIRATGRGYNASVETGAARGVGGGQAVGGADLSIRGEIRADSVSLCLPFPVSW